MNVTTEQVEVFRARINRVLKDESTPDHMVDYFDDTKGYASTTFNTLGVNEPDSIGPDDLLAVHMLSVDITPAATRALLDDGPFRTAALDHLSNIDSQVKLWEPEAEPELAQATRLWEMLKTLPGVDWVIAGKLLARKRPHLIPIADSFVWEHFQPKGGDFWETMRLALSDGNAQLIDDALRIDRLKSDAMRNKVSTLRLLDVAVWMHVKSEKTSNRIST